MSIREISFPSANGRDTVKAWAYSPLGKPRAVIQLIHGYGEHSRRYLHMIGAFNAAGFVVYADDHIGHGKTGYDGGTLGDPHSGGYMTYVKDEKALHDIAVADYPDVPYFVFGHSWGSMLARCYAAHYGEDIVGLMLCGLGCAPVYPCIIHSTPDHFGEENSQAIIGVQMASAYVGICVMPPLFGILANHFSASWLPWYLAAILVVMALMCEGLNRKTKACQ